jgi:hypothetical protein
VRAALLLLLAAATGCAETRDSDAQDPKARLPESQEPGIPDPNVALSDLEASGYGGSDYGAATELANVTLGRDREGPWVVVTNEHSRVFVLDREGTKQYTYVVPVHDQVETVAVLPGGGLAALSVDQGVTRFDTHGDVSWQVELPAHHEVCVAENDTLLVATHTVREWRGRQVRFDEIQRLSPTGEVSLVWDTFVHRAELLAIVPKSPLDTSVDAPLVAGAPDAQIYDRFHLNSIQVLPKSELGERDARFAAGGLLLALRNADLLVIVDPESGDIRWHGGPGLLDFPHMPRFLPTGRILVFDNGWHRGHSRVIEVDPVTQEVTWSYAHELWSKTRGSAERLPGGTTLIAESERGRAFEIDKQGKVLWEWWNPIFDGTARRRIYRMVAVPPGWRPPKELGR